jgi:hypothetical protein
MLPKTALAAKMLAQTLHTYVANAVPQIIAAQIADVSNYSKHGFVVASAGWGPIQVFGVPAAAAQRGVRIYCQNAGTAKNQRFIYQATAVACPPSNAAGSLMCQRNTSLNQGYPFNTSGNHSVWFPGSPRPLPSFDGHAPGNAGNGYFWEFYVNIPSLPSAPMCLFDFQDAIPNGGAASGIRCLVHPDGTISLDDYTDIFILGSVTVNNGSYHSTSSLTPGAWHYVVWQLGSGATWQALYLDGYSTTSSGAAIWTASGGFSSGTQFKTYNVNLFNAFSWSYPCLANTMLSKFSWGVSLNGSQATPPIYGTPTMDTQIPNGRAPYGSGLQSDILWLNQFTSDTPAAGSAGTASLALPDSGLQGFNAELDTYYVSGAATGPYND